jgi:23S rRNA (guanosine2251-2'-O)-methyltransferase
MGTKMLMLLIARFPPYTYTKMKEIVLLIHDIRSCHNVGSLLRTAEGLGVSKVYFTGYTPYPTQTNDERLPHIHQKLTKQISKTALGAETSQPWERKESITDLITALQQDGFHMAALEQTKNSIALPNYHSNDKVALLLGREVEGIDSALLGQMDDTIEIPMYGDKESFNVVQAAAMALYQLRFH